MLDSNATSDLKQSSIVLLGLPGAGKSLVAQSLVEQFSCQLIDADVYNANNHIKPGVYEPDIAAYTVKSETNSASKNLAYNAQDTLSINGASQVWCVIDTRSTLDEVNPWAKEYLSQIINITDVVVLSFLENSSLDTQAWWNRWLNQQIAKRNDDLTTDSTKNGLQVLRWFHNQFNVNELTALKNVGFNEQKRVLPVHSLQVFEYHVDKVMLEHLLMGLDNSRRTLGMNLVRVKAQLNTFEYENIIQLEITPNRFDQFAATTNDCLGKVTVIGENLDKQWFEQLIRASQIS